MAQIEPLWHLKKIVHLTFPYEKEKKLSCPIHRIHAKTTPPRRELVHKRFEAFNYFEPPKLCKQVISFEQLKKFYEIERQAFEASLYKSSMKLCSKLRLTLGLREEFEADATALADLDGFISYLADEMTDASELVKAARRRL